jgi:hypothetical protein
VDAISGQQSGLQQLYSKVYSVSWFVRLSVAKGVSAIIAAHNRAEPDATARDVFLRTTYYLMTILDSAANEGQRTLLHISNKSTVFRQRTAKIRETAKQSQ